MNSRAGQPKNNLLNPLLNIDQQLLFAVLAILTVGLVMIYSASISHADIKYGDSFYYLKRHLVFLALGVVVVLSFLVVPSRIWCRLGKPIFWVTILLLIAVLFTSKINGSRRWISLGVMNLQAAEVAKFSVILFIAGYLESHQEQLRVQWKSTFMPLAMVSFVIVLLFFEPDYGSMVVISATVLCMLFIVGVPLWQFGVMSIVAVSGLVYVAAMEPYRLERLKTFLDPWLDPGDSGYQITNSMMAFGQGEWLGVGLGNSVQKLHYLPEAHTDFIFSIYAEEFGLVGVVLIVCLYVLLVYRILHVARQAMKKRDLFAAYSCIGIAVILALQSFVNIGVTSGLLPTKGLTLPFVSYGGSSFIVCLAMVALVLRISSETGSIGTIVKRARRDRAET
jgi:cell division protein FtsW